MAHKREHRTPPPLARVVGVGVQHKFTVVMPSWGDIVRREVSFIGHVLRKDELEKLVVTGFVDGKRETSLTYLGKIKHKMPIELLQMAKNRTVWSKLCT